MLKKVYESHNKWINTVLKMGATQYEAEDIVGRDVPNYRTNAKQRTKHFLWRI